MLTKVYIDNYLCFSNFELELGPRHLIFGGNGTGKSSMLHALQRLRNFLTLGFPLEQQFPVHSVTKSSRSLVQSFEIGCRVSGENLLYRLEVEQGKYPSKPGVKRESLQADGRLVFEFDAPDVRLFGDEGVPVSTYKFDPSRSALQNVLAVGAGGETFTRFGSWLRSIQVCQIQPSQIEVFSGREDRVPNGYLSNLASWYRFLALADREADAAFLEDLRQVLDGFRHIGFLDLGEQKLLQAHFASSDGGTTPFHLQELSDGQRCMIGLYAILHFAVKKGHPVFIDEPDNFISLREIQPWLLSVEDSVDSGAGQALIISHHPEIINQWAVDCGIRFYREKAGPVRTKSFEGGGEHALSAAELIARGMEG
ncbi:MAG: AAA family ATPase [Bryobacterales bacterium]|nr:AAA family ATPase [Bryobacterales bacterium]